MSKSVMKKLAMALLSMVFAIVWGAYIGCSKIEDGETDVTDDDVSIASIALSTSNAYVKSDNSDSVTLSAMALDSDNGLVPNVAIQFSSTGGALGASTAITNADGIAETTFSAGNLNRANQTVTITASTTNVDSAMLPIQIVGTEVGITAATAMQIGGDTTDTLTVLVQDAGELPIRDAEVEFTIDSSSTGTATLSASNATTDINGQASIVITAVSPGTVVVRATSMGAYGTHNYTVDTLANAFYITSPDSDLVSMSTSATRTISVNAPNQSQVRFAATLGQFQDPADNTWKAVVNVAVASQTASATYRSLNAGIATIEVYDASNPTTKDTLQIAVSAPTSAAAQISIQASSTNVRPSIGGIDNTITLTATVKTDDDEPVGNAAVAFSIYNSTGGGEYVSPVVVFTNSQGIATSIFTSGNLSSDASGVTVRASVVNADGTMTIIDELPIVIGGTAGSIIISVSTEISSQDSGTTYRLPVSVMVADSNGNPVHGAQVSLSIWPKYYHTGYWPSPATKNSVPTITGTLANEDSNKNIILDAGEDGGAYTGECTAVVEVDASSTDIWDYCAVEESGCVVYDSSDNDLTAFPGVSCDYNFQTGECYISYLDLCTTTINDDDILTPPNSAAGTVDASVTTDSAGVGVIFLKYPKASAVWITDEFAASTYVSGTETRSVKSINLPYLIGDQPYLPNSPYNDGLF